MACLRPNTLATLVVVGVFVAPVAFLLGQAWERVVSEERCGHDPDCGVR